MKDTTNVMLAIVNKDKPLNRVELIEETQLSPGALSGTIFFLRKHNLLISNVMKTNTPPFRAVKYSLNPEKREVILRLLKRDGLNFG